MPKKKNFLGGMQNYDPNTGEYEPALKGPNGESPSGFKSFKKSEKEPKKKWTVDDIPDVDESFDATNNKRMGKPSIDYEEIERRKHETPEESYNRLKEDLRRQREELNRKNAEQEKGMGKDKEWVDKFKSKETGDIEFNPNNDHYKAKSPEITNTDAYLTAPIVSALEKNAGRELSNDELRQIVKDVAEKNPNATPKEFEKMLLNYKDEGVGSVSAEDSAASADEFYDRIMEVGKDFATSYYDEDEYMAKLNEFKEELETKKDQLTEDDYNYLKETLDYHSRKPEDEDNSFEETNAKRMGKEKPQGQQPFNSVEELIDAAKEKNMTKTEINDAYRKMTGNYLTEKAWDSSPFADAFGKFNESEETKKFSQLQKAKMEGKSVEQPAKPKRTVKTIDKGVKKITEGNKVTWKFGEDNDYFAEGYKDSLETTDNGWVIKSGGDNGGDIRTITRLPGGKYELEVKDWFRDDGGRKKAYTTRHETYNSFEELSNDLDERYVEEMQKSKGNYDAKYSIDDEGAQKLIKEGGSRALTDEEKDKLREYYANQMKKYGL